MGLAKLSSGVSRRRVLKQLVGTALASGVFLPSAVFGQSGPPSFQGARRPYTQVSPPYPAPVTPFYTKKGGVTNLRRYRGKVVVLNFWATWCPSCLHELPALNRLQSDLGNKGLAVVTVNVDEADPVRVARYFSRLGIENLPLLQDPAARAPKAFKTHHGLPWSFIIDRTGLVQGYMMGSADWDSEQGRGLIGYYLK
jgi:thiol-disulfide isomerase/thioredoxin